MVNILYSLFDLFCFFIISIIAFQNKNVGQKQKYFKVYLGFLDLFCIVDGFWGLIASHTILNTRFFLILSSTLFYFFSVVTSAAWLVFMITYSDLSKNVKIKNPVYTIVLIPVLILSIMLIINWKTGIIFSQFNGEYIRGQFQYVLLTYVLLYSYNLAALIITIFIACSENKHKNHLKTAILAFTIIPIITGYLQLRHPDHPYHAIGFTLSAFVIFIFEIIEEREMVADETLRLNEKKILDKCSDIISNNYFVDKNINSLLQLIGEYYDASRVYIIEFNEELNNASCTYEWHEKNVYPQIEELKKLPKKLFSYWISRYENGEDDVTMKVEDFKDTDPALYKMCQINNINLLINSFLKSGGNITGFIRINNPKTNIEDYRIIRAISIYIYSEILRRNNIENEQRTSDAVLTALAEDYSSVYYVNTESDELKPYRYNSQMKKRYEQLYKQNISYSEAYEIYVNDVVYSEDKDEMLEFGKIENLRKKLKYRKSVRKQYRSTINGKVEYFQAKWVKADKEDQPLAGMILGFASIDDQVRNNELINAQKTTIEKQADELSDVKEKVASEKRNSQIDRLTGLYNKIHGQHKIEKYIKLKAPDVHYVLMFIDIDHFKGFNDCYGHLVGDEVLIAVGDAIKSICRSDDIAIRFGGDEFVILLKNVFEKSVAIAKAKSLNDRLAKYSLEKTFNLSCSIGITITNTNNFNNAIEQADKALYDVKNTTRNDIRFYDELKNTH